MRHNYNLYQAATAEYSDPADNKEVPAVCENTTTVCRSVNHANSRVPETGSFAATAKD